MEIVKEGTITSGYLKGEAPTITVGRMTGSGEKDVTREEFVKVWVDHAGIYGLIDYEDMVNMGCWVDEIKEEITKLAEHSFDLKLKRKEQK